MAFDQIKYNNQFRKENYKTMQFLVPRERGDVLKQIAGQTGKSVSQCVVEALEYYYNIDLHTRNQE